MNDQISQYLKNNRIEFEIRNYSPTVKSAEEASKEINFPISQMFKSLVCEDKKGNCFLILAPCNKKVDLKIISNDCRFVSLEKVYPLTGYVIGTVSPFCIKSEMKIIIDKSALSYEKISVGCGDKGTELIVNREQAVAVLKAKVQGISV